MDKQSSTFLKWLVGLSVLVHGLLFWKFPFMADIIAVDMHNLDGEILRNNLLHGVWQLHAQPPLFNFFIGLFLKAGSFASLPLLGAAIILILQAILVAGVFYLAKALGASNKLGALAAALVSLFPSLLQTERWPHYSFPLAVLLVAAAVVLHRFVLTKKLWYFISFMVILVVMVLSRAFFHVIIWMLPLVIAITWYGFINGAHKKLVVSIAVIALFAGCSIYVKNYVTVGMFTSSTWQGMNLMGATHYVKPKRLQSMLEQGSVTPLVLIKRFSPPENYYSYYHEPIANENPAIDALYKQNGKINYNNKIFIPASKEYQKNAFAILVRNPGAYIKSILNEAYIFFGFFPYRHFDNYANWGSARVHSPLDKALFAFTAFPLPLIFFIVFCIMLWSSVKGLWMLWHKRSEGVEVQAQFWVGSFMLFNIAYGFALAITADAGEASYLRIPFDPFIIVLSVISLYGLAAARWPNLKLWME